MGRIFVSPVAARDLLRIWEYISERNEPTADRVMDRIEAVLPRLAEMPGIGHRRGDAHDARYRFWAVRPFLIAYRYGKDTLTIVRVLHGRQDVRERIERG